MDQEEEEGEEEDEEVIRKHFQSSCVGDLAVSHNCIRIVKRGASCEFSASFTRLRG